MAHSILGANTLKHPALDTAGHTDKSEVLLQSLDGQCSDDNHAFIHAVSRGLMDIEHGRYVRLADAKERLGLL